VRGHLGRWRPHIEAECLAKHQLIYVKWGFITSPVILSWPARIVVTEREQEMAVNEAHETHFGDSNLHCSSSALTALHVSKTGSHALIFVPRAHGPDA
jgi:hypothetical protein